MNETFGINKKLWCDYMNDGMRKISDEILQDLLYSEKPEGLTSGSALRALENLIFHNTGVLLKRKVYLPFDPGQVVYNGCQHDRKKYVGFSETYDYCSKCDKKL